MKSARLATFDPTPESKRQLTELCNESDQPQQEQ